jgi:hypothetical protein
MFLMIHRDLIVDEHLFVYAYLWFMFFLNESNRFKRTPEGWQRFGEANLPFPHFVLPMISYYFFDWHCAPNCAVTAHVEYIMFIPTPSNPLHKLQPCRSCFIGLNIKHPYEVALGNVFRTTGGSRATMRNMTLTIRRNQRRDLHQLGVDGYICYVCSMGLS